MVAGCPACMPNWLNIVSKMTASATHNRICFVRSFKFHLGCTHPGVPFSDTLYGRYTIPNCRANR